MWAPLSGVQADGGNRHGYPQERHIHEPESVFELVRDSEELYKEGRHNDGVAPWAR